MNTIEHWNNVYCSSCNEECNRTNLELVVCALAKIKEAKERMKT
jgi:hypothetical protein